MNELASQVAPIRTVLAAPRSTARSDLRAWLRLEPGLVIVGEAPNGPAALRLIERTNPDLAFLHIGLPQLDGFEIIAALSMHRPPPAVVLLADGPEGAVRAFGVSATDYLQFPFERSRLLRSLDRVRRRLRKQSRGRRISLPRTGTTERLAVPVGRRLQFINFSDLSWIRAAGRRSELHLRDGIRLVDVAFGALEHRLPPAEFLQINRSVIIRRDFIREIRPKSHGDHWVVFESGEQRVLTRTRREGVLRRLMI